VSRAEPPAAVNVKLSKAQVVGQFEIYLLVWADLPFYPQIMLVLEIAAGVLLGLLLYRGLDSFCKRHNLTMPAGVFAIGLAIVVICLPVSALVFFGPYVYTKAREKFTPHDKIILTNDPKELPPDPPGYFYIRERQRTTEDWNNPKAPLLRGGHCVADCATDHPLWLVPNPK
jgi:hypothetical protein